MALINEKFEELEKLVRAKLALVDRTKMGCFGTLLAPHCTNHGCPNAEACQEVFKQNGAGIVADIEVAAIAASRLKVLSSIAELEAVKAKAQEAPKLTEKTSKAIKPKGAALDKGAAENTPKRAYAKLSVDWDAVIKDIMTQKPTTRTNLIKVIKSHIDEKNNAVSAAYPWSDKIIKSLSDKGVLTFDSEKRSITWLTV
jgi:hypothetical protein